MCTPDIDGGCEIHLRGMKIGQDLQKRMKTGEVSEDRITNHELKEAKKLKCVDDAHTKTNDLTLCVAERYVADFEKFLRESPAPACPEFKKRVLTCLKNNRDDIFVCSDEIAAFSGCVDDAMTATSRGRDPNDRGTRDDKKTGLSYTEKFERIS